jgi:8-oxo-dGTP diphosphatase
MDGMCRRFYNSNAADARAPFAVPGGSRAWRGEGAVMRRKIRVVGAMIERDGCYLITQRPPTASLPLLWEFPGGRVEPGETDQTALARELREEMGITVEVGDRSIHVEHAYEGYDIDFCVYRCRLVSGPIQHIRVHAHCWVRPEDLDRYEFPPADEKSIAKLLGL